MGNCCCWFSDPGGVASLTEDTLCGDFTFNLTAGGTGTATIFQVPGSTVCGSVSIFLESATSANGSVTTTLTSAIPAVINTVVGNTSSATFKDLSNIVLTAAAGATSGSVTGKYCIVSHYTC